MGREERSGNDRSRGLDLASGASLWSYSDAYTETGEQCRSAPGGQTFCSQVSGGGTSAFVARSNAVDSEGRVWTVAADGRVLVLDGQSGALLSSTRITSDGPPLDAPIVAPTAEGDPAWVVFSGRLLRVPSP